MLLARQWVEANDSFWWKVDICRRKNGPAEGPAEPLTLGRSAAWQEGRRDSL